MTANGRAARLELSDVAFAYAATAAVRGVSLRLEPGEFCTLLGPSGCGKTTLLRLVAGSLPPQAGRILLDGADAAGVPMERRRIGTVYQNYALFPHLSALENVAFGPRVRGATRAERTRAAAGWLARVGLTDAEGSRLPRELSGGQQQRVALARALATSPRLLLLDEPFANLDAALRLTLGGELRRLHAEVGQTTLMVTHDRDEALSLSDQLGVLRGGRLVQFGPPAELYARPRTPFVAGALGPCRVVGGRLVRPEQVRLGTGDRVGTVAAAARYLGGRSVVELECGGQSYLAETAGAAAAGERVRFEIDADLWPIPDADTTEP